LLHPSLKNQGTISDKPQVGTEGYDAIVAVMDLLSMHGDEVLAPLNVTTHDFLVLLKEAAGTTIIPPPTVELSLSEALHKINGTSPLEDSGQEDGSWTTTNAARAAAAAAAITVNEQLTAAKSAVAQATSHLELMREIVNQARVIADEATCIRMAAHETLAAARRERAAAIDPIDVTADDESQCVAELHTADMDTAAAAKSQLATGAQALFESATHTHPDAVHALNALRERTTNANTPDDAEGSVRTYGMMTTPRLMSSLSTTPTVAMATATVTPGLIFPRNDIRRAASLLNHETNAAIQDSLLFSRRPWTTQKHIFGIQHSTIFVLSPRRKRLTAVECSSTSHTIPPIPPQKPSRSCGRNELPIPPTNHPSAA